MGKQSVGEGDVMDTIHEMNELAKIHLMGAEYSLSHRNGNRSSKRTNLLHEEIAGFLCRHLELDPLFWEYSIEKKIPCARSSLDHTKKNFGVDIVFTHKHSGKNLYVLFKSIEKSYNKNKENFSNCSVGETERIFGYSPLYGDKLRNSRQNDVLLFVELLPTSVLNGKKPERTRKTCPDIRNLRLFHPKVFYLSAHIEVGEYGDNFKSFVEGGLSQPTVRNAEEVRKVLRETREAMVESSG
jgi:hypothetical protein